MLGATRRLPRMRSPLQQAVVLALATAFAVGCITRKDDAPGSRAAQLLVRPSAVSLRAGETVQLEAQVNDDRGAPVGGAPLVFRAESTSIVRVSRAGLISAVGVAGRDSLVVRSDSLRRVVPVVVTAGHPTVVNVVGGADQSGLAGETLTDPLVVTIRDAYGNAVAHSAVRFNAESGGEAVPASTTTDAAGTARVLWTLGPLAGAQYLVVQADSAGLASATIDATARAGAFSRVVDVDPVGRRISAGDTVVVRLRALDGFGNGVEGAVFAFRTRPGSGEVIPPRLESDSTGLVRTRWRTGTTAGSDTLEVHAFQARDTSFKLVVRTIGGSPSEISLVSGDNQRARAGAPVARPPVVRVVDRYGNPVNAVRVRFSTSSPGASVQPTELVTNDRGTAAPTQWQLGTSGEQLLLIVADGLADTVRVRARVTSR